jgi:hypothetical protein
MPASGWLIGWSESTLPLCPRAVRNSQPCGPRRCRPHRCRRAAPRRAHDDRYCVLLAAFLMQPDRPSGTPRPEAKSVAAVSQGSTDTGSFALAIGGHRECELPIEDPPGRPFGPSSDARIKRLPRERDRDTSTLRLTKSAASAGRIGHSCGATFQRLGAVNRWRLPPAPGVRPIHRCPKCSTGRSWRRKLRESGNIR